MQLDSFVALFFVTYSFTAFPRHVVAQDIVVSPSASSDQHPLTLDFHSQQVCTTSSDETNVLCPILHSTECDHLRSDQASLCCNDTDTPTRSVFAQLDLVLDMV